MAKHDMLPGVLPEVPQPIVVNESIHAVRRARRQAMVRDALDVALLIAVDFFFVHWPHARVPFLDRGGSLELLLGVNVLLLAYIWMARAFPRWRARRMASTWSAEEQTRLMTSPRSRASR